MEQWKADAIDGNMFLHVERRVIRKRACSIRNQGCWNVRDAYFSSNRMLSLRVLSLRWVKFSCDDRMTQLFCRRIHLPEMNACLDRCGWGTPRYKRCRHSQCRPIDWTRQRRRRVCTRLATSYIVSLNRQQDQWQRNTSSKHCMCRWKPVFFGITTWGEVEE